jgi:hypothetical protein
MHTAELDIVTGAFSRTGQYIAGRLLRMGRRVRTLTVMLTPENISSSCDPASPKVLGTKLGSARLCAFWLNLTR